AEYYRQRAGLTITHAFFDEFERSIALLLDHPQLGALWLHGKRRLIMRHFPYSIVYTIVAHKIQVLAVAHQNRRPGYWQKRTQ
ncbi:type II toxin-antitoxin system RelE/ParE family toxin, partial [Arthrospira platensis SPKY1]|nr:type II toxin-antitoxin system RelE/ParE family toxin [Arthrospira platensis SPKY1]